MSAKDCFFELASDFMAVSHVGSRRWTQINRAFAYRLGWTQEELASLELIDRDNPASVLCSDGSYVLVDWYVEAQDGLECWVGHERRVPVVNEIHHRLKNVLQYAVVLISFQSGRLAGEGERNQLEIAESRVRTLARLLETTYASPDFAEVELGAYLRSLLVDLRIRSSYSAVRVAEMVVPLETAMPLAIVAHEWLLCATEAGDAHPQISLQAKLPAHVTLAVRAGVPLCVDDPVRRDLVDLLVDQLRGSWTEGEFLSVTFPFTDNQLD